MNRYVYRCLGVFIVISLALTGCNKVNNKNPMNQYGIQPPVKNLYWGMTTKEIEKELSIKEGVDGVTYRKEEGETFIQIPDKYSKFGYKATAFLEVSKAIDTDWFPYKTEALLSVTLICKDIDKKKLKEKLVKEFGSEGMDWISLRKDTCTTWQSEDKIKDLKLEEWNKLKEFWDVIDEHAGEHAPSKYKLEEESINSVTLTINPAGTDCSINYKGDTAIAINKLCISDARADK